MCKSGIYVSHRSGASSRTMAYWWIHISIVVVLCRYIGKFGSFAYAKQCLNKDGSRQSQMVPFVQSHSRFERNCVFCIVIWRYYSKWNIYVRNCSSHWLHAWCRWLNLCRNAKQQNLCMMKTFSDNKLIGIVGGIYCLAKSSSMHIDCYAFVIAWAVQLHPAWKLGGDEGEFQSQHTALTLIHHPNRATNKNNNNKKQQHHLNRTVLRSIYITPRVDYSRLARKVILKQ